MGAATGISRTADFDRGVGQVGDDDGTLVALPLSGLETTMNDFAWIMTIERRYLRPSPWGQFSG